MGGRSRGQSVRTCRACGLTGHWPVARCVHHTQHAHDARSGVVNEKVVAIDDELARASNFAFPAQAAMGGEKLGCVGKPFVEFGRSRWVCRFDEGINSSAILQGLARPIEPHGLFRLS